MVTSAGYGYLQVRASIIETELVHGLVRSTIQRVGQAQNAGSRQYKIGLLPRKFLEISAAVQERAAMMSNYEGRS